MLCTTRIVKRLVQVLHDFSQTAAEEEVAMGVLMDESRKIGMGR
jgi:hypothetical protein